MQYHNTESVVPKNMGVSFLSSIYWQASFVCKIWNGNGCNWLLL